MLTTQWYLNLNQARISPQDPTEDEDEHSEFGVHRKGDPGTERQDQQPQDLP